MATPKTFSWDLRLLGYLIFACGASGFVIDYVTRIRYSLPQNMGIVLGNGALTLLGLITYVAAKHLQNLDKRLSRIEDALSRETDGRDSTKVNHPRF